VYRVHSGLKQSLRRQHEVVVAAEQARRKTAEDYGVTGFSAEGGQHASSEGEIHAIEKMEW